MPSIHDPVFHLPPSPPHRWGTGPFHARGVAYRDDIAFADRVLAPHHTTVAEVAKKTGDAVLEKFVTQRFESSGWYDVQPLAWLAHIVARARGVPIASHVRDAALGHAQSAIAGFSGVLLKLASNETVATWIPRISTWFHDFGSAESHVAGPRHVRGVRSGLPIFFVHVWSISATSFVERVLAHAGAKEPRAHTLDAEPSGSEHGVPLYKVTFDVHWNE